MDLSEHSVTLISIIVGIGLTEMFGNLHRLIRNPKQVTWDWLPVTWSAVLLLLVVNYWWAIYSGITGLNDLSNAAELGLVLIQPIVLFLLTASVLPNFGIAGEWNMRRYYDDHRRAFILTFILYQAVTSAVAVILGTMGWNIGSLIRATILVVLILLVAINRRWSDWIGVVIILAVLMIRLSTQITR